ncbi:MAG: BREX-3 system phosphatase PglZ, partial [Lentisphaerae bacterium]|nr:BREX-3 system phosphatase PglZ [Lentisphaerota bacterium]
IECRGAGRPSEGVVADTRGERARIYPSPELRQGVAEKFPAAVEWQQIGLPAEFFPLLADGEDAFIKPGEATVAHGGIAIEEVLVPLVKIERRTR